jgi:hypothetical protein
MKYIFLIILSACNAGEKKVAVNIQKYNSDTISMKFLNHDDFKILKEYCCKIIEYNEIYPNEEDLKKGIQFSPDRHGVIHISKKNLDKNFLKKFQVCYSDKSTEGFQRFYFDFKNNDTTYIVNYHSRFRVTFNNKIGDQGVDLMKVNVTKYFNDSIVDQLFYEYNYLKYYFCYFQRNYKNFKKIIK